MDIRPPKRQQTPPQRTSVLPPVAPPVIPASTPAEMPDLSIAPHETNPTLKRRNKIWWIIGGSVLFVLAAFAAVVGLYLWQLTPLNATDKVRTRVTIVVGSTPSQIADTLLESKLIRSARAFEIYTRLSGTRNQLQAGSYSLSPSLSTQSIVDHLVSGKADQFKVTFFTGGTLFAAPDVADQKKTDVETMLLRAGFTQSDVTAALEKSYSSALFAGRPSSASLEGYVYGDTYVIDSSTTAEQLLRLSFTTFYDKIAKTDIIDGLKAQGLTLYQGMTLASIVQAEMGAHQADMPQVAQVFLKRLSVDMPLGSDVTAYYGADRIGAKRSVAVDTPYNTRIHTGLPPGPIGSPSLAALKAVAHPAPGNYLFFLSGDDGTTYFAATDAEHESNKVHCQQLCAIP